MNEMAHHNHDPQHFAADVLTEEHKSGGKGPEQRNEKNKNRLRLFAAIAMVFSAAIGAWYDLTGNTVFSLVGTIFLALSIVPDDMASSIVRVGGIVVNSSLLQLYQEVVGATRGMFQRGDGFVRGSFVVLAVGGTALICHSACNIIDPLSRGIGVQNWL